MNERQKRAQAISRKIIELRASAEWSQSELARQAGVTPAAISQIEKGNRIPSVIVSRKIASAFKVPVAEITGDEDQVSGVIDAKAQAFFRDFGDLADLDEEDQQMIKEIVNRLKENSSDENTGGK